MSKPSTPNDETFPALAKEDQQSRVKKQWRPKPLELKYWGPVLLVFVALAIGLEVALKYSQQHQGWPIKTGSPAEVDALQYAYHLPPVVLAMLVISAWGKINTEVLRLQPYVVLSQGPSSAESSVLLDYTRGGGTVWLAAAKNRHFLVSAFGLLTLLLLVLNPMSSNIFVIGDVAVVQPGTQTINLAKLGLNINDPRFQDYTVFLTAAGFSGASVQYSLHDPPFTFNQWTVAPFSVPTGLNGNGTVTAYTTAAKSTAVCVNSDTMNTTLLPANAGYTNFATWTICNSSWDVDRGTPTEFEVFNATCNDDLSESLPSEFRRVVFWYFTSKPAPLVTAVFCTPSVELWQVSATLDLATFTITSVEPSTQVTDVNITTLNGRGYNGIESDDFSQDYFSVQRQSATKVQLPAAVLQVASTSGDYTPQRFTSLTSIVYNTYLKTFAKDVFFIPNNQTINVQVTTLEKRGKLSPPATHISAVILIFTVVAGAIVLFMHHRARANLKLWHQPGTIASVVAMGAGTEVGDMLRSPKADLSRELRGMLLRLDPVTSKVVIVHSDTDTP